jgi:uncharacterized protein YprB with RNaseH-like and TPR domain
MLKNTFCHISGIGQKSEKRLWDLGIHHWDDVFNGDGTAVSIPKKGLIIRNLETSLYHLDKGNPVYFESTLPSDLHWRLFPEFREKTAYLDIETTGLDFYNDITTIALYDGSTIRYYVNGRNLDDFVDDILKYTVIVTYNGKCFDVPFLQKFFNIRMEQAHIDLRYVLKSLGFSGGLKRCEHQMGIDRGDLNGIDGFFAVLLWEDYIRRGNEKALETLLAYNIEDVVNLETLMVKAYNMKLGHTPFLEDLRLPEPLSPKIPYRVHGDTVENIKYRRVY